MRTVSIAIVISVSILLLNQGFTARADDATHSTADTQLSYPGNVAMSEEPPNGMVFRHFPSGLRLYVYDKDSPGKSACNVGCDSAWPPLMALPGAKPMGEWTLVTREDGGQQWAYKNRPVYMRFHDDPSKPVGDGMNGVWHVLTHFAK